MIELGVGEIGGNMSAGLRDSALEWKKPGKWTGVGKGWSRESLASVLGKLCPQERKELMVPLPVKCTGVCVGAG